MNHQEDPTPGRTDNPVRLEGQDGQDCPPSTEERAQTSGDADVVRGRLYLVVAALMWSTSGAFTKILSRDTFLHLNDPPVSATTMACFRVLFAGLLFLPFLRRADISFRPLMLVMVVSFVLMNYTFVAATRAGTAANAVLLQYTAPMWMFLASVWWLGEQANRRNLIALLVGLTGIGVIVCGGWQEGSLGIIALALASGVTYAGVLICLRALRGASPPWLTVLNHVCGGLVLLPLVLALGLHQTTLVQWGVLFLYAMIQMGIPYLLAAQGLRTVSPQEAGTITLLEPLLNPVWTYLVAGEQPSHWTLIGGVFILGALAYRYWPFRR